VKKLYLFPPKIYFMKRITLALCSIFLLTTVKNLQAQNADEMKAYQDFMTPGAMHKWMAKFNGTWEAEITSYMNPAAPDKSKATNVMTTIMNGLYQVGDHSGNMMGMPFQGRSIMGYDNAKKMFVSTWVDNMGSGIIYMTGTYDDATKTLNLKGKQTNPMNGKDAGIREVMKITDDNTYTLEMYGDGPDGKEIKYMEGTFKRKK
jgi:uncharacterized protein DUF1579